MRKTEFANGEYYHIYNTIGAGNVWEVAEKLKEK